MVRLRGWAGVTGGEKGDVNTQALPGPEQSQMGPVPVLPPWFGGQAVDAWPRGGDVMLNCQYPQQRCGKGVGRVPWGSVGKQQ